MALAKMAARPISVEVTPAGGSLVTCTYVKDIEILDDVELIKDLAGNSQLGYYFQGEISYGVKFTTPDLAVREVLKKGTYLSACTVKIEGIRTADGSKQGSADVVKRVFTHCIVVDSASIKSDPSGKPVDISYTIVAAHAEDATEGTIVDTFTLT